MHEEDQICKENTHRENETVKELTITLDNDEAKTDYKDYSDLDPILPLEGLPQAAPEELIVHIPGLEDVD